MIIEITTEEYDNLMKVVAKMIALENAGVDNWEGYSSALEALEE